MDVDPEAIAKVLTKRFQRKTKLLRSEPFRWLRPPAVIWEGTIYVYKLAGPDWPHQIFVFQMPKDDGSMAWTMCPKITSRRDTPQDAVKEAHRAKWTKDMERGTSN